MHNYSFENYSAIYKRNHKITELSKAQEHDLWFGTGGNVKALEKWLEDKCEMPIDEFVADLMEHTPRDYYEYLE